MTLKFYHFKTMQVI